MGATDGVDPLDAAHVQYKAGDDSRIGNLVISNGATRVTQKTMRVPIRKEIDAVTLRAFESEEFGIPYPDEAIQNPTITLVSLISTNLLFWTALTYFYGTTGAGGDRDLANNRGFVLRLDPIQAFTTINNSVLSTTTGSQLVGSTVGWGNVGTNHYAMIENEILIVQVVDGTHLNFVSRGQSGTSAASHASGSTIKLVLDKIEFEGYALITVA